MPIPLIIGDGGLVCEPLGDLWSRLKVWFDPSYGIVTDGATSRVTAWRARVGGVDGLVASQALQAKMPSIVPNAYNGRPVVRWSDPAQALVAPGDPTYLLADITVCGVWKVENTSCVVVGVLHTADVITAPYFRWVFYADSGQSYDFRIAESTNVYNLGKSLNAYRSYAYAPKDRTILFDDAFIDVPGGQPLSYPNPTQLLLGNNFRGDLADLMIFAGTLTEAERRIVAAVRARGAA